MTDELTINKNIELIGLKKGDLMNCKNKTEYVVGKTIRNDPTSYYRKIKKYNIIERSDGLRITELKFNNEPDAQMVCDFLNNKLDEKVKELVKKGEIKLPFDFLKEWDNRNENRIVKRFERWQSHCPDFIIKCHFKSDLLIFNNAPFELSPFMICQILDIPYEPEYGASTVMSKHHILNVSKVRENNG